MPLSGDVIEILARVVDCAGIAVVLWGVGVGLVGFVSTLIPRRGETSFFQDIAHVRCKAGAYLLLGLEILIASDIAQTVIDPTYERVILLGAVCRYSNGSELLFES